MPEVLTRNARAGVQYGDARPVDYLQVRDLLEG
jgi:hypothetical protein